eukprot:gene24129-biopygen17889
MWAKYGKHIKLPTFCPQQVLGIPDGCPVIRSQVQKQAAPQGQEIRRGTKTAAERDIHSQTCTGMALPFECDTLQRGAAGGSR